MNPMVVMVVVLVASAVLFGAIPLLQWLGRWPPPGNPDLITQRSYFFLPHAAGLLVLAAALLLGTAAGEGLVVALFVVGLLLMLTPLVLVVWAPQWLRPRWQKEYMAEMGYDRPGARRRWRRRPGGGS